MRQFLSTSDAIDILFLVFICRNLKKLSMYYHIQSQQKLTHSNKKYAYVATLFISVHDSMCSYNIETYLRRSSYFEKLWILKGLFSSHL